MTGRYTKEAATFVQAIAAFQRNPEALETLEGYLALHFDSWLEKFAATPEDIAAELKGFSQINCY